jgi:RNA polymerase sigma factor (TIGR02999 family)
MCENEIVTGPNSSDPPILGGDPSLSPPDAFKGTTRQLFPVVYQQLRDLAHRKMAHESGGLTLQTTALVHEVYLRLSKDPAISWENPRQFFAVAAESMRRILVERARRYASQKRGGGRARVDFDSVDSPIEVADPHAMVALDEALTELSSFDAGLSEVVMLRYFTGLSVEETAAALDRSPRTVKRDWSVARAWLSRKLSALS